VETNRPSSTSSFGTFLRTVEKGSSTTTPIAIEGFSTSLLRPLAAGPLQVDVLRRQSGLGIFDFSDALRKMSQAGLVELTSATHGEEIRLSSTGLKLIEALSTR
jgi:hypothetical protein